MYSVTQQYTGTASVRTQYVHTPGEPVTQSPGTLGLSFMSVSLFSLLCDSLRLHLFPSSLYYSPPLVIVYKLTITTIIRSFTSCDGTILILAIYQATPSISTTLTASSWRRSETLHAPVPAYQHLLATKRTNWMAQENHQMSTFRGCGFCRKVTKVCNCRFPVLETLRESIKCETTSV